MKSLPTTRPMSGPIVKQPVIPPYNQLGTNLEPQAADYSHPDNPWGGFWLNWNWDGWIRPNIDLAHGLGLTGVRIIGVVCAIYPTSGPSITLSQYLTRLEQAASYCGSLGMSFYATGGDFRANGVATTQQITDYLVAQAQVLSGHKNIFGFDVMQEITAAATIAAVGEATILGLARTWADAIRTVWPTVALTFSGCAGGVPAGFSATNRINNYAGIVDYYDFHPYDTDAANLIDGFTARSTKPVVFGEMGAQRTLLSSAQITAQYDAIRAWRTRAGSPVVSCFNWSLRSATASNDLGIYDVNGVLNTDVSVPLLAFPH